MYEFESEYMSRLDQEDLDDDAGGDDQDNDIEEHTCLSDKVQQLLERQQLYEGYLSELTQTSHTWRLPRYQSPK